MIKRLTSKEYYENAQHALLKLCSNENPNPFEKPFLKTIKHQVITMGGVPRF